MKKLLIYGLLATALLPLASCGMDEPNDTQTPWREENDDWMLAKQMEKDADGNPVYEKVNCAWDPNAYVLMQWHNDRSLTASKLKPISTSTVDVRYEVRTIDGKEVDNSKNRTTPAPGVYRSKLNSNITGWVMGIATIHVGHTCTILIPYSQAYGSIPYNGLKAYSSLIFNVRLVDIPGFEKPI